MCRKALAVILIIIFIPILFLTIIGWNLKLTILNPIYWTNSLEKSGIYEKIYDIAPKYLLQMFSEGQSSKLPISEEEVKKLLKENLSADYLKSNLEETITQVLGYLNGQYSTIQKKVDLAPIKKGVENLTSSFLQSQLEALPECKSTKEFNPEKMNCRPPGYSLEQIKEKISSQGPSQEENLFANIPDSFDLGNLLMNYPALSSAARFVNFFKLGLYIASAVAIFFLLLIGLLIFRPLSSLLKWLATALLIPGILIAGLALASTSLILFASGFFLTLPADLKAIVSDLVASLVKGFSFNLYLASAILAGLTLIFYILAKVLKPKVISTQKTKIKK